MANFEEQIENVTNIDITTDSQRNMVDQWLKDGVIEVINRVTAISPGDTVKFSTTTTSSNNSDLSIKGKIISVMRSQDATTTLRRASMIDPSLRYDSTDVNSIHYRSKYNPAYYILDGKINVAPDPSATDVIELTQVSYDQNINYASSAIINFPIEYEYLVPMYASIKLVFRQLSILEADLGTMTIPEAPMKPIITTNVVDISSIAVPTFNAPIMNPLSFGDTDNWISVEEDSEMLGARVTEIKAKIEEYSQRLQTEKGEFEEANTKFQSEITEIIENVKFEDMKETRDIQSFQSQVSQYKDQVIYEVSRYQYEIIGKTTKKYEWLSARHATILNDYNSAFSVMGDIAGRAAKAQQQPQRRRQ